MCILALTILVFLIVCEPFKELPMWLWEDVILWHRRWSSVNFGGRTFLARKYMYEKLTTCPNSTWYLPEKLKLKIKLWRRGAGHFFARKYMYEKLTMCPNFTWYLSEFFSFFGGGTTLLPPISYAYVIWCHTGSVFAGVCCIYLPMPHYL